MQTWSLRPAIRLPAAYKFGFKIRCIPDTNKFFKLTQYTDHKSKQTLQVTHPVYTNTHTNTHTNHTIYTQSSK